MNATPPLQTLLTQINRLIAALVQQHAHAQVVVTLKDGVAMSVHVNQTFLPGDLPKV